jgi:hypothetical protein
MHYKRFGPERDPWTILTLPPRPRVPAWTVLPSVYMTILYTVYVHLSLPRYIGNMYATGEPHVCSPRQLAWGMRVLLFDTHRVTEEMWASITLLDMTRRRERCPVVVVHIKYTPSMDHGYVQAHESSRCMDTWAGRVMVECRWESCDRRGAEDDLPRPVLALIRALRSWREGIMARHNQVPSNTAAQPKKPALVVLYSETTRSIQYR